MKSLFTKHAVKVLGYVGALAGALGTADPLYLLQLFGDRGPSAIALIVGVLTILKGHTKPKEG